MGFFQQLGKKHEKKTVNFIKLWDEIGTTYIQRNQSMLGEVRGYNMYADTKALYSKEDNITFVYTIDGYPRE